MDKLKSLIFIPICILTACAPPRPGVPGMIEPQQPGAVQTPQKVIPVEKRKEAIKTVSSWDIRGAMSAKNKSKGWSATMNWVQHGPETYQIRLMGPLGGGTVLISKTGKTITFQDGAKKITSTNASELLRQQTGISLPVNNLYYWIRGIPAPGQASGEHHDQYGHLDQLRQSGYTITFGNYTSVKGVDLPGLIRLEGNGVMVKVAIKNWSI